MWLLVMLFWLFGYLLQKATSQTALPLSYQLQNYLLCLSLMVIFNLLPLVFRPNTITAKAICQQQKKSFVTFSSPFQHGVATDGGIEMLINHSQMVLENNPDWVVNKTDISGQFCG